MLIDPPNLKGKHLFTRPLAVNDYAVTIDGKSAGRIMLRPKSSGASDWLWTITGPALVQTGIASSGEAETFDNARAAFRETFDRWLTWAIEQDGLVHWMGGSD